MAKSKLAVVTERWEKRLCQLTHSLDKNESLVVDYSNDELEILTIKLAEAEQIILKFKSYYYNLETPLERKK